MTDTDQKGGAILVVACVTLAAGCTSNLEVDGRSDAEAADTRPDGVADTGRMGPSDATDSTDGSADTTGDVPSDTGTPNPDTETDTTDTDSGPIRILVFSNTEGYRHDSIEAGVNAMRDLASDRAWVVEHTEDAGRFTEESLGSFDVAVWLNTTGDVLDGSQQSAFEQWLESGGGYVGVHAAADTEYDWDWYGTVMGAWFDSHPSVQEATIDVEDSSHPATDHLSETWTHRDEWYNYQRNPRSDVDVLLAVDESTYSGGEMGEDHPIAWAHEVSSGRAFYTGLGHTSSAFEDADVREHLVGAVEWAAGR